MHLPILLIRSFIHLPASCEGPSISLLKWQTCRSHLSLVLVKQIKIEFTECNRKGSDLPATCQSGIAHQFLYYCESHRSRTMTNMKNNRNVKSINKLYPHFVSLHEYFFELFCLSFHSFRVVYVTSAYLVVSAVGTFSHLELNFFLVFFVWFVLCVHINNHIIDFGSRSMTAVALTG